VEQGILGTLISAELRMLTTQVRFRDPDYWLFKKKHSGGGMLAWLGCHYVDMVRHVTGEEIVSVSAEVATRNGEDIDVEDVAVLSFRLASGAVGVMHVGYVMALSGGGYHNIGGYDTYVGLNGQRGRLHWSSDGTPTQLRVESDHPEWSAAPKRQFDFTLSSSPAYGGVHGETFVQDFLRATWGEGDVPASGKDALQVARVVEAAYESSESGRRVQIPTD
jgi:predicted dehydrogenase